MFHKDQDNGTDSWTPGQQGRRRWRSWTFLAKLPLPSNASPHTEMLQLQDSPSSWRPAHQQSPAVTVQSAQTVPTAWQKARWSKTRGNNVLRYTSSERCTSFCTEEVWDSPPAWDYNACCLRYPASSAAATIKYDVIERDIMCIYKFCQGFLTWKLSPIQKGFLTTLNSFLNITSLGESHVQVLSNNAGYGVALGRW